MFTSLRDDTIAGDTNNDGQASQPAVGDWQGITANGGSRRNNQTTQMGLTHVESRYAASTLHLHEGQGVLKVDSVTFPTGHTLKIPAGWSATVRGSLSDWGDRAIEACPWGSEDCGVDATHVDWGSDEGPFPGQEVQRVCGQVSIDPWIGMNADRRANLFAVPNCDGTSTPDTGISQAQSRYHERLSYWNDLCALSQDACDQIDRMQRCYAAALDLAKAGSTFPIPETGGDWVKEGGNLAIDAGSEYLRASSSSTIAALGDVLPAVGKIIGAVSLGIDIENAYNSCAY